MVARNYKRFCLECGKEFLAFRPSDKWCSISCKDTNRERNPVRKQYRKKNNKDWRSWNREVKRDYMLQYVYGITSEQYEEILTRQNRCCAICLRSEKEFKRKMDVEHDHQTREIQGIVCTHCNRHIIGRNRSPEIFARVVDYLQNSHTGLFVPVKKRKRRKH